MHRFCLLFSLFFLFSCSNDVSISHEKTNEEGVITWRVENPTDQNITRIEFAFRYRDENGNELQTDTVEYKMDSESPEQIFLKARDYTWISRKPIDGASDTEVQVLSYSTE